MRHVAKALVAHPGAFLSCGLLARAGAPIGLPTIPLFVLAGVALVPHTPGFDLVDKPTADPPRPRLTGTRRRRSRGREGTCRSPT